jgi:hypothetical protein
LFFARYQGAKMDRSARRHFLALLCATLAACAVDPYTYLEWPLKVDGNAPISLPGEPRLRQLPGMSSVDWWTADGESLGIPHRGPRLRQYPTREGRTLAFKQWLTTSGHFVAEGAQPGTWHIAIMAPGKQDSVRWEVYGPTLQAVRLARWIEEIKLKDGGDILYFTKDGAYKASQLAP